MRIRSVGLYYVSALGLGTVRVYWKGRANKIRHLRIHFREAPVLLASIRLTFVIMDTTLSSYAGALMKTLKGTISKIAV